MLRPLSPGRRSCSLNAINANTNYERLEGLDRATRLRAQKLNDRRRARQVSPPWRYRPRGAHGETPDRLLNPHQRSPPALSGPLPAPFPSPKTIRGRRPSGPFISPFGPHDLKRRISYWIGPQGRPQFVRASYRSVCLRLGNRPPNRNGSYSSTGPRGALTVFVCLWRLLTPFLDRGCLPCDRLSCFGHWLPFVIRSRSVRAYRFITQVAERSKSFDAIPQWTFESDPVR